MSAAGAPGPRIFGACVLVRDRDSSRPPLLPQDGKNNNDRAVSVWAGCRGWKPEAGLWVTSEMRRADFQTKCGRSRAETLYLDDLAAYKPSACQLRREHELRCIDYLDVPMRILSLKN